MNRFKCNICGARYDTAEEAEKCFSRGMLMPLKKSGTWAKFTRTTLLPDDSWTYSPSEGLIKKVEMYIPKHYPGHDFGFGAVSYVIEEPGGEMVSTSYIANNPLKVVAGEYFFEETLKIDPKLRHKAERVKKMIMR